MTAEAGSDDLSGCGTFFGLLAATWADIISAVIAGLHGWWAPMGLGLALIPLTFWVMVRDMTRGPGDGQRSVR